MVAFDSVAVTIGSTLALGSPYMSLNYLYGSEWHKGSASMFQGFLDGFGIYNEALTILQIGDVYNPGSGDN